MLTAAVAAVVWPRPPAACPPSVATVATIGGSPGLHQLSPAGIGGPSGPGAPVNDLGRIQVSGCPPAAPSLGGQQ
ncbi:MAG TPA: hypothetical protein VE152_07065 [Acidimicrobiales bacterium]|nr:hypothetical protein [Acidimicrobiales bacterium]